MLAQQLLDNIPGVQLLHLTFTDHAIICQLAASARTAACPLCGQPAQRVHSQYSRHPADLPWSDCAVRYDLLVRRFFCDNPACRRQIFAERFGPALRAYSRRTTVLAARLQDIGLTVGGAVGAVLATLIGSPVSASTMIRLVRSTALPTLSTPRVLSVDDFAFRKRQTYGTILVDLERHCPVDLLPDREPETVATWLRQHPGVEIISRDRSSTYAQAARDGAPQAIQIADRYHLAANLGEALHRLLDRHSAVLQAVTEQLAHQAMADIPAAGSNTPAEPRATANNNNVAAPTTPTTGRTAVLATPRRATPSAAVYQRFQAIKDLQAGGHSQREIARRLALNRRTVQRYLGLEAPPVRAVGTQSQSKAQAYWPYLQRRWAEGCRNAVLLWAELQQQGFSGSYSSLYRLVVRRLGQPVGSRRGRELTTSGGSDPPAVRPLSARQGKWLLVRRSSELAAEEEQQRALLCAAHPAIATAYELAQRFMVLIRERQPEGLDPWIQVAKRSGVAELRNFALGIERDQEAVRGALSQPYSQGQTEGQVNRLKFIKRSGYGRMKFDLLRLRVLYRPNQHRGCSDHQK